MLIRQKYMRVGLLMASLVLMATCTGPSGSREAAVPVEMPGRIDPAGFITGEAYYYGEFSAYNPSEAQTDDSPLIMASGKRVYSGAAACPIDYDFGTRIEVEGLGVLVCEDRMAKRYREKKNFDIMMFDHSGALRFGRRSLRYRVLDDWDFLHDAYNGAVLSLDTPDIPADPSA
jgi:hypothetical protein